MCQCTTKPISLELGQVTNMSQSLKQEQAEVLQDICSDSSPLQEARAIFSRQCVGMDERGNLLDIDEMDKDVCPKMLIRKDLVLGCSDRWDQHSLDEANDMIRRVPDYCDTEDKIERFINKHLQ